MYHFSWFQLLTGPLHLLEETTGASHDDAIRVLTSWGVCLFLVVVALGARAGLNKAMGQQGSDRFVPASNLGLRNLFGSTGHPQHAGQRAGKKDAVNYYWLLGSLFLYVFVSNLMSVMPGFLPPRTASTPTWPWVWLCWLSTWSRVSPSRAWASSST